MIDYNQEFEQPACATCDPDHYTPTPYRASDPDPIVVGLNLVHAVKPESSMFATLLAGLAVLGLLGRRRKM